jgi:hypothetical protein
MVGEVVVYNSAEKLTSDDYPYGRRTTALFSVEYNKRGARTFKRLTQNWQN